MEKDDENGSEELSCIRVDVRSDDFVYFIIAGSSGGPDSSSSPMDEKLCSISDKCLMPETFGMLVMDIIRSEECMGMDPALGPEL